ncbi:serine protease [Aquipseudomonas alcaligenes]|nr:serine protease [Pseudomonas alcaligenes]
MESLAEQLLYLTVRLEGATKAGTSVGTGFLYMHKERLFVVTNKHVVAGVVAGNFVLRKAVIKDGEKVVVPGEGYTIPFNEANFIGHPSAAVDVAAMNISKIITDLEAAGNQVLWKNIVNETSPKAEDIEKYIGPVEDVVFIGYPSGIWDSKNLLPVVRKGITATPYYVPFQGEPKFLIDASVFPGSSGSPVFIYYAGSYPDKAGNLYAGSRAFFLGILAQVFQRTEQGDIKIKEVPTAQVAIAEVQQMIDLGIVFNDSTVIECLSNYLAVVGGNT